MLAYILALVVGLSSVALYMAAFFFPEVHRKHDFLWSGLGMFYALVLWVCAGRITGGVLLGQTASVVLLGWMGWQMLVLRRQVVPVDQQTAVPTPAEWQAALSQAWAGLSRSQTLAPIAQPIGKQVAKLAAWVEALVTTTTTPTNTPPSEVEERPYVPLTPADFANARQTAISPSETIVADTVPVQTGVNEPPKEKVQPKAKAQSQVKGQPQENPLTGLFKGLTAKRESKPVYVRKQFRTPETAAADSDTAVSEMTVPGTKTSSRTKTSSHASPETLASEPPLLEEPSLLDAIDVTFVEAQTPDSATPSPSTANGEPTSETEPSP